MIEKFLDNLARMISKKQDEIIRIPGEIGDLDNNVYVPGRPNYIYVRISGRVSEVYNNKVDPALDLKVWVSSPTAAPYFQEVLSERGKHSRYGESNETAFHVKPHHGSHEYPSPDTVWVQGRQFLPFRVSPAGGMSVSVFRNVAYLDGEYQYVSLPSEDLSSYGIAGDLAVYAKYLLLEISVAGEINIVEGSQVDYDDLVLTDIPDPTDGATPLAAIRIYSGQTEIVEARTQTDIIDLRFAYSAERPNMILGHLTTDYIDFNTAAVYAEFAGRMGWNSDEYTINIVTGLGPVLQVGQELYTIVFNDTGSEIKNATAVYPVGAVDGHPSVSEADSASHVTIAGIILVTTMDVPDQGIGIVATILGKVRGVDTTSFSVGETLWIAPNGTGLLNNLTNIRPEFPNYLVQIGGVNIVDEFVGVLQLAIDGKAIDTIQNYHNGTFRETFKFNVTSNGTIITGTLTPANGHPNMTGIFSDGFAIIDTDPSATIELTPGTDADPQEYFIYIPKSPTKVLTVATGDFPYDEEIIQVAHVSVQTAATVDTYGARRNQNYNNQIQNTETGWGGRARENDRVRQDPAAWKSGVEGGSTIIGASSPDDVYLTTTAGIIYQLGRHIYDARDMQTGDDLIVFNDSISPNKIISNLNLVTLDSSGNSLTNRYFSIVLICAVSSAGDPDQWGINLPSNSYSSSANAIADGLNYSNYLIPSDMGGVSIRATRYTFGLSASGGGTWTLYDTDNSIKTETSFGGGGGGSGATTYDGLTDTPSSKVGQALKLVRVESGEVNHEYVELGADIINAATGKTTPVDADTFPFSDSAASNLLKKVSWANIKATLKTYFDEIFTNVDGWIDVSSLTWIYANPSTFIIAGDQTDLYKAGIKLKWTQTTIKYGIVESSSYSSPNTTVKIIVNTDYILANAAITLSNVSRLESPDLYPHSFAFSPTFTNLTIGNGTLTGKLSVVGQRLSGRINLILGSETSVDGVLLIDLPTLTSESFTAARTPLGITIQRDDSAGDNYLGNTVYNSVSGKISPTSSMVVGTTVTLVATNATTPFTWATDDEMSIAFDYNLT